MKKQLLGYWISEFLTTELLEYRKLSINTVKSYRDTFVIFLKFLADEKRENYLNYPVKKFTSDLVKEFLQYLESNRNSSASSCNQRLAAIKSFSKYLGYKLPEQIHQITAITFLQYKKAVQKEMDYLDHNEISTILSIPNKGTKQGFRDYVLILLLINTGARASEISNICVQDFVFGDTSYVKLMGKGKKERICPLWKHTAKELQKLITANDIKTFIFWGERKNPLTRHGIYEIVERIIKKAQKKSLTIAAKNITPHSLRHSTAMELLSAGVDINTIRAWLGHVSIETTNIYATIDLKTKEKAIQTCSANVSDSTPIWKSDDKLLAFLKKL